MPRPIRTNADRVALATGLGGRWADGYGRAGKVNGRPVPSEDANGLGAAMWRPKLTIEQNPAMVSAKARHRAAARARV